MNHKFLFLCSVSAVAFAGIRANAQNYFIPGDLVVSDLQYQDVGEAAALVSGSSKLPNGATVISDGGFPEVYSNEPNDSSFGITAPIFLDQFSTSGSEVNSLAIDSTQIVNSFASKSEGALNLSQDGTELTFAGYQAPPGSFDRSNSSTPGAIISGNVDPATPTYRAIGEVNAQGQLTTTLTNAYTGDNPRAAILGDNGTIYAVGNQSGTVVNQTGVQIITLGVNATASTPGTTQAGVYNITQNGDAADKVVKDNNFRGEAIFNNTLYVTKGSGGNGINTVYQVGSTGSLPTGTNNVISILPGFPTGLAKNDTATGYYPFGLWFANATTLYIADEGDNITADVTGSNAVYDPNAGLEKWTYNGSVWQQQYTLQLGLNIGQLYSAAGDAYDPATAGLRNLTGQVNANGTVTIYAITSTVSNNYDNGMDPDKLVAITDTVADSGTAAPAGESFTTLATSTYGDVYRGVAFAPVPEPGTWGMAVSGIGALLAFNRIRKRRS